MRFHNFWTYRRILFSKTFLRALWHSRRNVLADARGNLPLAGPFMAEFDITYRCNCRCRMCQRWDNPRPESLTVAHYRSLAQELHDMAVHQISIAGGEPLMREDVFDIIAGFAEKGQSVNLCTNGMLVERYSDQIISSGATCVTISLDGVGAESHDAIRGIKGSYAQIERGIRKLLTTPFKYRPIVRVRMTVSNLNQHEIGAFYQKWAEVADDVLLQPVHHCGSSFYTGMQLNDMVLNPDVLAQQMRGTPLARDSYMRTFIANLNKTGTYPQFRCYAGVLMVRIDPWGNVYPCLEQHIKIGSILEHSFRSLWHSAAFDAERQRLRCTCQCRCWYNNTALIGHYGHWLQKTSLGQKARRSQCAGQGQVV